MKSLDRMCKPDFPDLQSTPLDCQSRQLCHPYVCSAKGTVTQYILRYPLWSSHSEPEGNFSCLHLLLTMMSIFTHCDLHFFFEYWILKKTIFTSCSLSLQKFRHKMPSLAPGPVVSTLCPGVTSPFYSLGFNLIMSASASPGRLKYYSFI